MLNRDFSFLYLLFAETLPHHLNRFLCLPFALTTTRCFARISWRTTLDYTPPLHCAQLFHHRSFHSQRRQEREERRRRMEAEIAREGTAEPTAASGTDDIAKVLFLSRLVFSHAHRFTFCFATHRLVHWVIALFDFSKKNPFLYFRIQNCESHTFIYSFAQITSSNTIFGYHTPLVCEQRRSEREARRKQMEEEMAKEEEERKRRREERRKKLGLN